MGVCREGPLHSVLLLLGYILQENNILYKFYLLGEEIEAFCCLI